MEPSSGIAMEPSSISMIENARRYVVSLIKGLKIRTDATRREILKELALSPCFYLRLAAIVRH